MLSGAPIAQSAVQRGPQRAPLERADHVRESLSALDFQLTINYLDIKIVDEVCMQLHHVQISMPRGEEALARRFYQDALGMTEVAKPVSLAGRGGCWFRAFTGGNVSAEIHLGVDDLFVPANKAHPALLLSSVRELETLGARVSDAGCGLRARQAGEPRAA